MNAAFADTSALLPFANAADIDHRAARQSFEAVRQRQLRLISTSYVLIETYAVLGRRLGMSAVAHFRSDFAPLLEVVWVDEALHEAGLDLMLQRARRHLSLVDAVSFAAMRRLGMSEFFGFDSDFEREGFTPVRSQALP